MTTVKQNRRKKVAKPKVFNEKRESMMLIKAASPADIYIWAISLVIIFIILTFMLTKASFSI